MAIKKLDHSNFVRSNRLVECYRMIGAALAEYENNHSGFGTVLDLSHYRTPFPIPLDIKSFFQKSLLTFEQGVSFVPVEYLVAYLEDLLDLEVTEERLCIPRQKKFSGTIWIVVLGLCFSIASGLYVVQLGGSLLFSFALTVLLALPFGLLWHLMPRDGLSRRIKFAKLVQNEITRRKGGGTFITTPLQPGAVGKIFGKAPVTYRIGNPFLH